MPPASQPIPAAPAVHIPAAIPPSLQWALVIGAWVLVVLLLTVGIWFLRQHRLLHTALTIILSLVALFLLVVLRELALMVVMAAALAFILAGPVDRLSKRMRRPLAITLVYLALIGVLALGLALGVPKLSQETRKFIA